MRGIMSIGGRAAMVAAMAAAAAAEMAVGPVNYPKPHRGRPYETTRKQRRQADRSRKQYLIKGVRS